MAGRIRQWLSRKKLNVKFTIVIGLMVVIPFTVVFFMVFHEQQQQLVRESIKNTEYTMSQRYLEIQKTVEMCNMTSQVFINSERLKEFLVSNKKGQRLDTEELVNFYHNDIGTLEKLTNSNPYLYQTRVYAFGDEVLEMLPILYSGERLKSMEWGDDYTSGEWQFDYQDRIWEEDSIHNTGHIMSLITVLEDYDVAEVGVLEVAVDMTEVFPDIFAENPAMWECFVSQDQDIYGRSEAIRSECLALMEEQLSDQLQSSVSEPVYLNLRRAGREYIVGCVPVRELSGYLIRSISLDEPLSEISRQRNIYLAGLVLLFILLFFVINLIIKALLKHFYGVIGTIRQVQNGNLDVRAAQSSQDEIGELGQQINKMLDRIKVLMQENIDRELLAKNSEIRALQNQINAHFIYNVLESIKMMAEIREDYDISDAVTSLGRLLRYSMRWVSGNITVEQEIQYIRDYIWLMNLRFDYQIQLNIKIPPLIMRQQIPKMSLQPIIENAIYHGIEELAEDAVIQIKGIADEKDCRIEITDSGLGMNAEQVAVLEKKISGEMESSGGSGNGIGLKNVQDRIRITFGDEYGIQVVSKEQCYTKVSVRIPLTVVEEV